MTPLGLTGYALGKELGVPRTRIERLAAEQTPVSPDTAIRLGRYFGTTPDFWMNLQTAYDLTMAEETLDAESFGAIRPRGPVRSLIGGGKLMRYLAFIHKDPDSVYGVSFPDLPECYSAGNSLEEATQNAVEALSGHVRLLEANDSAVPLPRPPDEIIADPDFTEWREDATLVLIPLVRDLGSTTRINVSLDMGLLEALDAEARQRRQTRSAFIASAVRKELIN